MFTLLGKALRVNTQEKYYTQSIAHLPSEWDPSYKLIRCEDVMLARVQIGPGLIVQHTLQLL